MSVISVEKAPEKDEAKRKQRRLHADYVRLHKVKKTPGHPGSHKAHYFELVWQQARDNQPMVPGHRPCSSASDESSLLRGLRRSPPSIVTTLTLTKTEVHSVPSQ
jgi:hypothetical protein